MAQKILAAEVTELIHGSKHLRPSPNETCPHSRGWLLTRLSVPAAKGLKQALAATELFFGDNLAALDTPALAAALDGTAAPGQAAIPSMVVTLKREEIVGQPLERFLIASTLVESKSKPGVSTRTSAKTS